MRTFWRREEVEERACNTLLEFQRRGGSVAPPIDVDTVGELVYDLRMDWDVIPEDRRTIWGGLYPRERRVVINETHKSKFIEKPGFERFTKGHEIGHWVLHVDQASQEYPLLPGLELGQTILCRDGDDSWIERQANWYSGALLMPYDICLPVFKSSNLMEWKSLYQLADQFGVTITALRVRLRQLKLGFLNDENTILTENVGLNQISLV